MKRFNSLLAVAAMFCLIIAVLLTSVEIAVYGDPMYRFYEKEYEKYNVTDSLSMDMDDVMAVTEFMMSYLIGNEEELSISIEIDGRKQDFFNEQDRIHMADVSRLFIQGLRVRNICVILALLLVLFLIIRESDWKRILPKAYFISLSIFLAATILIGALFAINFTKYFTIFHEIFFTNDLWLFDEATDYMIRMLPEGFFYDMAMRIGFIFIGLLVFLAALMIIWRYAARRFDRGGDLVQAGDISDI